MEKILFLNFNDLVKVKLKIKLSKLGNKIFYKNLLRMYERFEVSSLDFFDLEVNINSSFYRDISKLNIEKGFSVGYNYIFSKYKRKFTQTEVEIIGIDDAKTTVNVKTDILGKFIFPTAVINSLIGLKSNLKGVCFVHSSGISKQGKAVLFAGDGSSGKTFLVIESSKRNFNLVADDFTFIGNKVIYNFIRPISLEYYHRKLLNFHLSFKKKLEFILKKIISIFSNKYISLLTHIDATSFFYKRLEEKASLKKIYYLTKGLTFNIEIFEDKGLLIDTIINNTKLINEFLFKLCKKYSLYYPHSNLSKYWDSLKMNLAYNLKEIPCYKLTTPFVIKKSILEEIFNNINQSFEV